MLSRISTETWLRLAPLSGRSSKFSLRLDLSALPDPETSSADLHLGQTAWHLSRVRPVVARGSAPFHVRVLTEDSALLRELTLDPSRDYQRSTAPTLVRHQVRQRSAST